VRGDKRWHKGALTRGLNGEKKAGGLGGEARSEGAIRQESVNEHIKAPEKIPKACARIRRRIYCKNRRGGEEERRGRHQSFLLSKEEGR